ncbi:hypothetical protein EES41_06315 [Streptomyces sp. ADI95-16]|nr:hypothetical protein EES41_06315 [Streptomyces sp. ADI95-16]
MATPATVACTPLLYVRVQMVSPSGTYHHQPLTRKC